MSSSSCHNTHSLVRSHIADLAFGHGKDFKYQNGAVRSGIFAYILGGYYFGCGGFETKAFLGRRSWSYCNNDCMKDCCSYKYINSGTGLAVR